jgi:sigma-E factor negative regulatory protein RseA
MNASPPPREPQADAALTRQILSSLADGELGGPGRAAADEITVALQAWRLDPEARRAWHSYQLAGDVLRSDDLARPAAQDQVFLNRFRERFEAEPVHLPLASVDAPATTPQARPWSGPRRAGAALAASVAVAAAALLLVQGAGTGLPTEVAPALAVNSAGVLRDPRLDEFLRMHQMARGGLAVGVPGGTLQRADLQMPGGADR